MRGFRDSLYSLQAGVDSLVFLHEREDKNYTFLLHTPLYYNLKVMIMPSIKSA